MDEDVNVGKDMVEELGIDGALGIESDQRAELLREWHRQDAEKDAEKKRQGK